VLTGEEHEFPALVVVDVGADVVVVLGFMLVARVVEDGFAGEDGAVPLPPVMAMSAQERYICPVWKEFHLKDRRVWLETKFGIRILLVTV
jgi:hypothetical protein